MPFSARKVPQIGLATCMPVSDGASAHYKKVHTRLRSFEILPQMSSPDRKSRLSFSEKTAYPDERYVFYCSGHTLGPKP